MAKDIISKRRDFGRNVVSVLLNMETTLTEKVISGTMSTNEDVKYIDAIQRERTIFMAAGVV